MIVDYTDWISTTQQVVSGEKSTVFVTGLLA